MRVLLNEEEKKNFHNVCKCLKEHIDNIEKMLCEDEKLKSSSTTTYPYLYSNSTDTKFNYTNSNSNRKY